MGYREASPTTAVSAPSHGMTVWCCRSGDAMGWVEAQSWFDARAIAARGLRVEPGAVTANAWTGFTLEHVRAMLAGKQWAPMEWEDAPPKESSEGRKSPRRRDSKHKQNRKRR